MCMITAANVWPQDSDRCGSKSSRIQSVRGVLTPHRSSHHISVNAAATDQFLSRPRATFGLLATRKGVSATICRVPAHHELTVEVVTVDAVHHCFCGSRARTPAVGQECLAAHDLLAGTRVEAGLVSAIVPREWVAGKPADFVLTGWYSGRLPEHP